MTADTRLTSAVAAWRESLVMLSGQNRLLNYRPTRSSTLEFVRASTDEVLHLVEGSRGLPVVGTVQAAPAVTAPVVELEAADDLEARALEVVEDYDYSDFSAHLFVDNTQREVDRALKNLSSTASREYLDRGLSVLYLALGALHWFELNGDARVSPLVFLPVELKADGPRQPPRLYPSDGDLVVNPALDIRVRDYGVVLPDQAAIESLIVRGGMAAVEAGIRELGLPEGWRIEPMCVLSAFMFAKEAMFRDLEAHESAVLDSPIVQALAGASERARERTLFTPGSPDDVDQSSPPESASLILDADSSQRVAVEAAAAGKSFVLDGPPGTGKSQTIANIIATLVGSGKKVLFVSEKAVALDVVRDRLSSRGLGPLLFELHSHKATRAEVAKSLGAALTEKPSIVQRNTSARVSRARKLRSGLSDYAAAMNEVREPIGWTLHDVIGALSALPDSSDLPAAKLSVAEFSGERWNDLQDVMRAVAESWSHLVLGERHIWFGIRATDGLRFDLSEAASARIDLLDALDAVAPRRASLGLDGTDGWRRVEEVSARLRTSQPSWIDRVWLSDSTDDVLERFGELLLLVPGIVSEDEELTTIAGAQWRDLATMPAVPSTPSEAEDWLDATESGSITHVRASVDRLGRWATEIAEVTATTSDIASSAGLAPPRYLGDLESTAQAIRALDEIEGLRSTWLTADGFASLEQSLAALEVSQKAAADAEIQALGLFQSSISEVDVSPVHARWIGLSPWRKAIFGPSADDRQLIGAHSRLKPRAAVASTEVALNWQNARTDLVAKSAAVAVLLGYVPSDDIQWTRARQTIAQCREIRDAQLRVDAQRLAETRANDHAWRATARESAEVSSRLRAASVLITHGSHADDSQEIGMVLERAKAVVQSVGAALDAAVPFADGGARSLKIVRDIQSRVIDAAVARGSVDTELSQLSRALPGAQGALTRDWVEAQSERLAWTMEFRRTTSSEVRMASVDILREVAWSPLLVPAGEQWDAAVARVRARFEHDAHDDALRDESESGELLTGLNQKIDDADVLIRVTRASDSLRQSGLDTVLNALLAKQEDAVLVEQRLRSAVLRAWVEGVMRDDSRLISDFAYMSRDAVAEQFRELDREIVDHAAATVLANAVARRPSTGSSQTALILAEASKKRRHIPVRDLISRASDVIQAVHPCFMMSPLAVSQFLPADIRFDVVIFDEASQVPPGDAINCLYRADALIAAGDQKQLPPTAFFASTQSADDEAAEEDLAHDYESLLDLMKGSGAFTSISLLWHYRSKHEHLIAYSNNSFYEDRLITFPGALADVPDAGVKFLRTDGIYRRSQGQDNPKEAEYVADRVIHHLDTRPGKSVGVVAMSAAQRDAIANALVLRRSARPDLESHFGESRLDGIFVKSLEEVQGDERDVIIMSIGYGPDSTGTVYKNFGPINSKGGERRLNVAITRAKELTEVVASMSAGDIGDVASAGGRHLRRYLDYAERGPAALELELGPEGLGTDSPFEDAVISAIRSWGYEVQPQVGVSGFRIDIGVKHPNRPGVFMLGVECDGAMYHSAKSARDRDRLRHDILVGLGWNMHHIWGTDWYRRRETQEVRLRELLQKLESDDNIGRFAAPAVARTAVTLEVDDRAFDAQARPEWVSDYRPAKPRSLRNLDWTDSTNARHLVAFVEEVTSAEGPLHLETMKARLREHSSLERVNKNAERTLRAAIDVANVVLDGEFLRLPRTAVKTVREAGGRALDHIDDGEFTLAVMNALSSQVGPSRADLALAVARAFGWRRTGAELSERVGRVVDRGVAVGEIDDGAVLRLKAAGI